MEDHSITKKQCTGCGRTLPVAAFVKHRGSLDGLYSRCKECHRSDQQRRTKWHEHHPQPPPTGKKSCSSCAQELPIEAFGKRSASSDGLHYWCKACNAKKVKAQRQAIQATDRNRRPPTCPASGLKCCASCERTLPIADFGKRSASPDGLHYWCRACNSMKVRAQRDAIQARPHKLPANGQKHCSACRRDLPIAEFGKRSASPDGLHYWCKSCISERGRSWRESNPEIWRPKHRVRQERRLRRIYENGGNLNYWEWEEILQRYDHRCVACGKRDELTLDHIVPVSKGGGTSAENVQPLCRSCNASKGATAIDYRPDRRR